MRSCPDNHHLHLQEIATVCARALERQTRHAQLQQHSTATVLLDEGGLPGVSSTNHISPTAMAQDLQCALLGLFNSA